MEFVPEILASNFEFCLEELVRLPPETLKALWQAVQRQQHVEATILHMCGVVGVPPCPKAGKCTDSTATAVKQSLQELLHIFIGFRHAECQYFLKAHDRAPQKEPCYSSIQVWKNAMDILLLQLDAELERFLRVLKAHFGGVDVHKWDLRLRRACASQKSPLSHEAPEYPCGADTTGLFIQRNPDAAAAQFCYAKLTPQHGDHAHLEALIDVGDASALQMVAQNMLHFMAINEVPLLIPSEQSLKSVGSILAACSEGQSQV